MDGWMDEGEWSGNIPGKRNSTWRRNGMKRYEKEGEIVFWLLSSFIVSPFGERKQRDDFLLSFGSLIKKTKNEEVEVEVEVEGLRSCL